MNGEDGLGYGYNKPYVQQVNSNSPIDFSTLEPTLIISYDYQTEAYAAGDRIRVIVDSNSDNWLEGYVYDAYHTIYNGAMTIAVERWNESSTYATSNPAYSVYLTGERGPAGVVPTGWTGTFPTANGDVVVTNGIITDFISM
jgi:hypothetical protein